MDTLFDTHAHLIADDWERYKARPFTPDLPTPDRPAYSVTVDALIGMMDEHRVERACLVQRGHVYGYDNSYILDAAHDHPGRLHPVVILDTQDPRTPALYREMVRDHHCRGFRMANARPWLLDTAWMSSPAAMEVWKACADLGTPMTMIMFMNQLPYLLPLVKIIARQFPDLPILLDHGAMPFGIGPLEIIIVLVIVLLIFGPKRLPEIGRSLGSGMREFKDSVTGKTKEDEREQLEADTRVDGDADVRHTHGEAEARQS